MLDQVPMPLLLARVTRGAQSKDTIVVTFRLGLQAAGGASLVVAGACCSAVIAQAAISALSANTTIDRQNVEIVVKLLAPFQPADSR